MKKQKIGKNNLDIKLPDILLKAYRQGFVSSVILFGSSVYGSNSNDVDLAIITKASRFNEFLDLYSKNDSLEKYDISLIREEEIDYSKKFYFGSHGQHLVESLRRGITLIGENPFKNFSFIKEDDIKLSIFERMKEYMYVLRKGYFDKKAEDKFYSRYDKMIKLSAFLLTNDFDFPDVLNANAEEIQNSLDKVGYIPTTDKNKNIENIWIKISELY